MQFHNAENRAGGHPRHHAQPKSRAGASSGILLQVDSSFEPTGPRSFRAGNDQGYLVDLIRPQETDLHRRNAPEKIGQSEEELYAVGIDGPQWLVNAPKIEETVIGSDDMPLLMSCIDPRAFALHKLWLSRRADRSRRSARATPPKP